MRTIDYGWRFLACGSVALLSACSEGPVSPDSSAGVSTQVRSLRSSHCREVLQSRSRLGTATNLGGGVGSASWNYVLPTVIVRGTFYGGFGVPSGLVQAMNYSMGGDAGMAPCLNSAQVSYQAETAYVNPATVPALPSGVNPDFWATLSPREKRALLARAEELMRLYPQRFSSVGNTITQVFEPIMRPTKVRSKLVGIDYFGGTAQAELFAGGVYGCLLYRGFVSDPNWHLLRGETLALVTELVTAFAEAQFAHWPLRGLHFGRNGAFGAGLASSDMQNQECGRLLFNSIPSGAITVTDPYAATPNPSVPEPPPDSYNIF